MEQLKSYLSLQKSLGNVLVVGDGQREHEMVLYLQQGNRADDIFRTVEKDGVVLETMITDNRIDTVLFGENCTEILKDLTACRVRYLIGSILWEEDYFGLWELYRTRAEHIYLVRERSRAWERDGERYEILEWDSREIPVELSVIVPVYNVRSYLEQCIQSLIIWQAPYVEYLLVDDGSTDGSGELIDAYVARDSRIRHIRKPNGGCASARNLGIKLAKGNYVGFVDGDDFVDSEMFPTLFRRAMMGRYEIAYCGYREYREEDGRSIPVTNDCRKEPYLTGVWKAELIQRLVIRTRVAIWRCLYRRELLIREKIVFHEELNRFDDLPFKVETGFLAKSVVCVPEYLYEYRVGRPGQDVACKDERLFVHFDIFRILDERFVPMRNRRLLDYLQIVKLHTHGYALRRIERRYYDSYLKMARQQLDETAGVRRTLLLMLLYGGRGNAGWYLMGRIGRLLP